LKKDLSIFNKNNNRIFILEGDSVEDLMNNYEMILWGVEREKGLERSLMKSRMEGRNED